jgi:hypothetical protein
MSLKRKLLAVLAAASFASSGLLGLAASTGQAAAAPSVHSVAPAADEVAAGKWKIRNTFFGKNGEDVPLRQGDSTFGYEHIQEDHPTDDTALIGWIDDTLEDGKYEKSKGKVVVRNRTATGKMFRVVFTEREDSDSKDGRPVGMITAFLE